MSSKYTLNDLVANVRLFAQLKREEGAPGVDAKVETVHRMLREAVDELRALPEDEALRGREPDDLESIRSLRPAGPRRLGDEITAEEYRNRLAGALLGRSAGCILGSPVEGWAIERMEGWAAEIGDPFPPLQYWSAVPDPSKLRYRTIRRDAYTRERMSGIPVDDDLQYTLLGLLILEEAGPTFTVDDVGRLWQKYLPFACTAEDVALANLYRGVPAASAGKTGGALPLARSCYMTDELSHDDRSSIDNPYVQWIGADIRADPWGYVAPGMPELAADMAYRDAVLSHRRNGIYGSMFFAAAIAAAFVVDDPLEAIRIGLTEIPAQSSLAQAVQWAINEAAGIRNYRDAHDAVTERFPGMHAVHTVNNACLTVWGLSIGGVDLDRVISETVAMGYDNDCTAATAGSIVGAIIGRHGISRHWIEPFGDTIHTYLRNCEPFSIEDVLQRFELAKDRVLSETA